MYYYTHVHFFQVNANQTRSVNIPTNHEQLTAIAIPNQAINIYTNNGIYLFRTRRFEVPLTANFAIVNFPIAKSNTKYISFENNSNLNLTFGMYFNKIQIPPLYKLQKTYHRYSMQYLSPSQDTITIKNENAKYISFNIFSLTGTFDIRIFNKTENEEIMRFDNVSNINSYQIITNWNLHHAIPVKPETTFDIFLTTSIGNIWIETIYYYN